MCVLVFVLERGLDIFPIRDSKKPALRGGHQGAGEIVLPQVAGHLFESDIRAKGARARLHELFRRLVGAALERLAAEDAEQRPVGRNHGAGIESGVFHPRPDASEAFFQGTGWQSLPEGIGQNRRLSLLTLAG